MGWDQLSPGTRDDDVVAVSRKLAREPDGRRGVLGRERLPARFAGGWAELLDRLLVPLRGRKVEGRARALLGAVGKDEVLARKRVVRQDGEASELVTWWVPAVLAEGTDLASDEPLHGGVRGHLSRRKGVRVDHVLEQITARHPTAQEAKLLDVGRSAPMLAMYVAARDASGGPVLVLEVVMPGDRHELEDAYQVG